MWIVYHLVVNSSVQRSPVLIAIMAQQNYFQNLLHGAAGIPAAAEAEAEGVLEGSRVADLQQDPAPGLQVHQQIPGEQQAAGQGFQAAASQLGNGVQTTHLPQQGLLTPAAGVAPPQQHFPAMTNPPYLDLSQLAMQVALFQQMWQQQQPQQQLAGVGALAPTSAALAAQASTFAADVASLRPPHQPRREPVAHGIPSLTSPSKPAQKKVRISEVRTVCSEIEISACIVTLSVPRLFAVGILSVIQQCRISSKQAPLIPFA
jgi:hypothetical protein